MQQSVPIFCTSNEMTTRFGNRRELTKGTASSLIFALSLIISYYHERRLEVNGNAEKPGFQVSANSRELRGHDHDWNATRKIVSV